MKKIFGRYYQYWLAALPIFIIGVVMERVQVHYILKVVLVMFFSAICYVVILELMGNEYFKDVTNKLKSR